MALKKAMEWAERIEAEGVTRADISREENITRARVTQVMKLLALPATIQGQLMEGHPDVRSWSIRRAIQAASVASGA